MKYFEDDIFLERSLNLNLEFAKIIENKSVAIVGRIGVEGLHQGIYIDSFDVVIRFHNPLPRTRHTYDKHGWKFDANNFIPPPWHHDIGQNTHIFYQSMRGGAEWWLKSFVESFRNNGGQLLCCEHYENCNVAGSNTIRKFTPIRYLTNEFYLDCMNLVGSRPLSSTLIIADVLRYNPRELFITGCPCFVTPVDASGKDFHSHRSRNDFVFLKILTQKHASITVDSYMNDLFQIWREL